MTTTTCGLGAPARFRSGALILLLGGALCPAAFGAAPAESPSARSFADLSLEELANIQVTSVSRKPESVADAPASIFVITGEDIRRSAATTLPEALRLAPTLQVARVDARNYAISARGYGSVFSDKMLVLVDGRTVYSPLFSGTFWDAQDVVLEDIDRIEVISGPGATAWGTNAVNGVINIITRSAADTQGTLAAAGVGTREKNGVVRYGGQLANGGYFRVYGKYAQADDVEKRSGATDFGWRRDQAGFRTDWADGPAKLTLQGDAYVGRLHQRQPVVTRDIDTSGMNLMGHFSERLSETSSVQLKAYVDHTLRDQPNNFVDRLTTADIELRHSLALGERHAFAYGGEYRALWDRNEAGPVYGFLPGDFDSHVASAFLQDEIRLTQSLRLTLGEKLEQNSYTGVESLPSVRLAWKVSPNHLLWGALSRAARAPSRIDRDFTSPQLVRNGRALPYFNGGPGFASETARVAELGYRGQMSPRLSLAATASFSQYDNLRTLVLNPGAQLQFANGARGTSRALEMTAAWQATSAWRLSGGMVVQHIDTAPKEGAAPDLLPALAPAYGNALADPSAFWQVRSTWDIARDKDLDITLRHVGSLPAPTNTPAYTAMDLRYGWRPRKDLEISLIGQNLLSSSHVEFNSDTAGYQIDRAVFLKMVWRQ